MFWLTDEQLSEYLDTKCANYTFTADYTDYQSSTEVYNSSFEPAYASCPSGDVKIPNDPDYDDFAEVQTNPDGNGVHLVLKVKIHFLHWVSVSKQLSGLNNRLSVCRCGASKSYRGIELLSLNQSARILI